MSHEWTDDEIEQLPINGGSDVFTDPVTGYSTLVRRPVQFLVTDDDTHHVTDRRTGERWRIGRDVNGEYWKERF